MQHRPRRAAVFQVLAGLGFVFDIKGRLNPINVVLVLPLLSCYRWRYCDRQSCLTVPMTDEPLTPELTSPEALAKLNNNELAVVRTELAQQRTALAQERTGKSTQRTGMAETRTDLAENRTDLARERNRLAAERTLMAWIRTSLSLISFGFGIDRFFAYLKKTQANATIDVLSEERILGLSFITLGTFSLIAATITHWQTLRNIEQCKDTTVPKWSLGMIVAIVLVFIGLATYIPLITGDVALRNIVTLDSQIVRNLVSLTIFLIMLTMGINFSPRQLLVFWQQVGLVLRAQLAVSVLGASGDAGFAVAIASPKCRDCGSGTLSGGTRGTAADKTGTDGGWQF